MRLGKAGEQRAKNGDKDEDDVSETSTVSHTPILPRVALIEEKAGVEFVSPKIGILQTKDTDGQGKKVEEVSGYAHRASKTNLAGRSVGGPGESPGAPRRHDGKASYSWHANQWRNAHGGVDCVGMRCDRCVGPVV